VSAGSAAAANLGGRCDAQLAIGALLRRRLRLFSVLWLYTSSSTWSFLGIPCCGLLIGGIFTMVILVAWLLSLDADAADM